MNKLFFLTIISITLLKCGTVPSYESIGLKYIIENGTLQKNISTPCSGEFELTDSILIYNKSYGKPELLLVKDLIEIPDSIVFQYGMKEEVKSSISIDLENNNNFSFGYTDKSKYNYDKNKYSDINNEITSKELQNHFFLLRITESYNYDGNVVIGYCFKRGCHCPEVTYIVIIDVTNRKVTSCKNYLSKI